MSGAPTAAPVTRSLTINADMGEPIGIHDVGAPHRALFGLPGTVHESIAAERLRSLLDKAIVPGSGS